MKKTVLKDIARIAGVSDSTVSKAINNYSDIPEKTKKKILEIIRKFNYYPMKSARLLRSGKNETIAFLCGRISSHYTAEILSAIEKRAFETNKYVHGIIPYSTNYDPELMVEIFNKLLYGRDASAVVALAMNPAPGMLLKYKKAGIPVILIENYSNNAHSVNTDNRKAGFMAAEYLIKQGRKKIGLICGGLKDGSKYGYSYVSVERKAGFTGALKHYGIRENSRYTHITGGYTIQEGMQIFNGFMKKGIKPDALFCASGDSTAIGVIESAKKYGIKVPEDLAVVGFDDSEYSAYLDIPLTTIRQSVEIIGAEVFNTATAAIEGKTGNYKHIMIKPELIKRKSA